MLCMRRLLAAVLALLLCCLPSALAEGGADAVTDAVEAAVPEAFYDIAQPNDLFALTCDSATLGVGEQLRLLPKDWPDDAVPEFTMSKKKIVSISADGEVKALKKGSVTVTARYGGQTATCAITVMKAPKAISLGAATATLGYDAATGLGERLTLNPTLTKNTASSITYRGYDPEIISVSGNVVTAVGTGVTKLTAATFNGKTAAMTVTVLPGPRTAAFAEELVVVGEGASRDLKVVLEAGTASALSFESLDPGCARVDGSGRLTGVSRGVTQVLAVCFNNTVAICTVEVTPSPTVVIAEPAAMTLGVGEESAPISVTTDVEGLTSGFTFTSSKQKVATVDGDGVVKGVKKGSAVVKVSAGSGPFDSVKVTVKAAPKSVTLSQKALTLGPGDTAALKATLPKNSWSSLRFESDNEAVAVVDGDGLVTAVAKGTATITVHTFNGHTAACGVTVCGAPAAIVMDEQATVSVSQYLPFAVTVLDEDGGVYPGAFSVSFSPTGIAEYAGGRLHGMKAGSTVMTVAAGGIVRQCQVTVDALQKARVLSIAHRGGKPENTLEAFRKVPSTGADGVELDARSTKDGYQVIHHDATFKVGGKNYTLSKIKLSELRTLKPSVPTLDEALDVLDAIGLDIHLELKDTADGAKCVKAIRAHGLEDRTVYFSFYEKQLKQVHKADSKATLGLSLNADVQYDSSALLKKISNLHISFLVANKALMNQTVVDYWHGLGLKISVWTPNTRSEVRALCALGVDYILSDYPEYCVQER